MHRHQFYLHFGRRRVSSRVAEINDHPQSRSRRCLSEFTDSLGSAEEEQNQNGACRRSEGTRGGAGGGGDECSFDGEGAEAAGDGDGQQGREECDLRRGEMRAGGGEEGVEGVERGDRARGDGAVEPVLFVRGEEGGGGGGGKQWDGKDTGGAAERLLAGGEADVRRFAESFPVQFKEFLCFLVRHKNYSYYAILRDFFVSLFYSDVDV